MGQLLASAIGGAEGGQVLGGFAHALGDLFRLKGLDVFIWVVQHRVEVGQQVYQLVVNPIDFLSHCAGQLSHGVLGGGDGLRVDQVDDRFRLGQVHFAIQEGAAGKFPRLGLPRTGGEQRFQASGQHGGGAMALQFRRVLAGVAGGSDGEGGQAVVQHSAVGVVELAVDEGLSRTLQ